MGANRTEQAQIVTSQTEIDPTQGVTQLALFDLDGDPIDLGAGGDGFTPAAAVADSTADAIEGIVEDFNNLLAALRTAGIIAED